MSSLQPLEGITGFAFWHLGNNVGIDDKAYVVHVFQLFSEKGIPITMFFEQPLSCAF